MSREALLRKWVDALESGKYQQARSALRSGDSYCCLGVACDLFDATGWDAKLGRGIGSYAYVVNRGLLSQTWHGGFLPRVIRDMTGLTPGQEGILSDANDTGESFHQIAQRIRDMFPDVFTESVV